MKFHGLEITEINSVRLTQIAQADSAETRVMISLADTTSQDSRAMRIAAVVAMLYLPGNFVMVRSQSQYSYQGIC
jgi:ABC-type transporter Mla MlaB component